MGGFLSKKKIDPNNYEKALSVLDGRIQKVEMKLSDIKVGQRRTNVLLVTYSTLAWLVYITYCFLSLQQQHDYSMDTMVSPLTTIFAVPIGIYYSRSTLAWFYARRHTIEEAKLASLRAHQKLKVEELKRTTSYYATRSLLERYDSEILERRKRQQDQIMARQAKIQQLHQRKPVSMPGTRGATVNQHPHQDTKVPSAWVPSQLSQRDPPQWYDKIMDALIGEEGPETKYALICQHCFTHNGLILPNELYMIEYTCPHCRKFNPARKSQHLVTDAPRTSSFTGKYTTLGGHSEVGVDSERRQQLSGTDTALKKDDVDDRRQHQIQQSTLNE